MATFSFGGIEVDSTDTAALADAITASGGTVTGRVKADDGDGLTDHLYHESCPGLCCGGDE